MSRWWVGAIVLASSGLACAPKSVGCDVGEGFVYVDAPDGAGSVSSIEASGACQSDPSASCTTISEGCDGSACDCRFLFTITEAGFAIDPVCHLRAISPSGQVFASDVTITAPAAPCFEPYSPFVTLDFADAGVDGDVSDAIEARAP